MDRIYSEPNDENDFTDRTIRRRISSILKAPRTPLGDLENVIVTQDIEVEKPQRNSRRVSFAETIRVYPTDPRTILELDHAVAEKAAEASDQAALHQNEDLNVVQCDITGMNTLLHAPIQTPLELTECYDADKGREWNQMDRTFIFSEEKEMDMTAGHTIMITHNIGMPQTDKPRKEDCIFSDYLKPNKEASELKEFSFFSNPTKVKETSISQKKTLFENTQKIKLDDFLKCLKSPKLFSVPTAEGPFASSEVPERSMYSSEENDYFNSQKEKYNTRDTFCSQENRTAVEEHCISAEKAIAPPTGHPLGCGEVMLAYENQSTNKVFPNTGRFLPPETSSLNKVNQQESVRRGCMVTLRTDSCGLKTSSYQPDVEQDPRTCTVNNEEAGTAKKPSVRVTNSNASLASHLGKSVVPVPFGSAASMPAFHADETTVFCGFYADTEMTDNRTCLIWDENSKHTGNPCSLSEKQRNDISSLMEETVFEENNMGITNNQASTHSCLNNMQHSIPYNEMAALNQSYTNMGLLNPRLNSGSWESSPLERKGNALSVSLPRDRSAVFSAKNIDLNRIQVAKSNIKQAKSQFPPSVVSFHQTVSVETKADGKSRISDNAVSLIPPDKTVYYEDMEITKPTTCLIDKALKTAHFQDVLHQKSRTDKKSVTCLDSDKTVVFSLSDDNEIEITKSYTGAVKHIVQQFEQVSQTPTSQPINKTVYQYYNDMEETKPITYVIDPSLENIGPRAVRKLENEAGGGTLIGSTKEKTVVFSLTDENEMEITRSHTVALNHDIPQLKGIPNTPAVPSDKTVMFTFGDDIEITKPAVCATVKCLKNLTGSFNRPTGSAADKTVMSSHSRGDEIELTKSLTVTLEGQAHTSVPTGQSSMSIIGSNTMPTNSTTCVPGDRTVMFRHRDDMGITKPIMYTSNTLLENTGFKTSSQNKTGRMILPDSVKDEDEEMEITKSHTVAVNHDVIQQMKVGAQRLASDPSDKMDVAAHSSNNAITKSAWVPADKTVIFVGNKTMEITKPITHVFPKLTGFSALSQKEEEASKILLPGSLQDSIVPTLSENEMEITRSHTVAVNHDIVLQCEKKPQAPSVWNDADVAECHTVAKGNTRTNLVKPGKPVEWERSSDQMLEATADDMKTVKNHSMPLDSKTDLNSQPASQAELALAQCNIGALESFQDNAEITNLPFNTISNGNRVISEKQEISNKRIQESMDSMQTSICGGETKDTIYGSINNLSNAEKCIPNFSVKLEEKTIPFLDDNMEMIKNYTTGIELMHTNAFKDECHLLSQEKLNSDLPNSVDLYGIKLGLDKGTTEKSICSANVMPPASQTIVQERQRSLKIQVEPYTFNHINLSNKTASNALYHYEKKDSVWPKEMPTQNSKLTEETTLDLNTEKMCMLATENENLKTDPRKLSQLMQEGNCTGGAANVLVDDEETKNYKTASCEQGSITKDSQTNLNIPSEEKLQLSGIVNDCSKRNDSRNMSELVMSPNIEPVPGEQVPKLMVKLKEPLVLKESVKKFNNGFASNDMTNKSMMEGARFSVPLTIIGQNHSQMTKLPLGIFPPKLPNRRKSAIYNVEEICARSGEKPEIQDSENTLLIKKPSDKIMQNLSPSHYIDEELLPECAEEMDFSESLHYEGLENPCNMMNEREINNHEGPLPEIVENNRQKRTWNQEDEELQKEKKFKVEESWNDSAESKQPLSNSVIAHSHVDEGKNVPDSRATNLERTQSSTSSSLDSLKADTDFSIQQSNEMEAQLFIDSICEQNLQEKLQDGVITVREFFTLLQVHVLIQKPRQSQLPSFYAVNATPTPEDVILSQYVYRPKFQAYDEDCQILSDTIEELKRHVGDQDKLLVNVNKSLWEVVKSCPDEERKRFGAELNKMKSCFAKKSKVLAHRGKTKLYAKLLQNAQFQWEKLQSKLAKVDEFIKEMDSCRIALETETAKLENADLDLGDSLAEYESKLKDTENELKHCKAQEEALQREQSNLRDQKQQRVSEITHLQENVKNCQELLKKYNFSDWVLKEWDDHQAVFTFLYDSIELTVEFGCPVDDPVLSSKFCRKIIGVNFKSLLDETKASPSSKLVYRLIFQFINSHTSWQEKCSTVHHLSQMLHDISLVVSRCQLLGREIDFLDRWGGKFSLLKTEVNDTKVKLLFSSSVALAKFEVELSLSASYPASPVAFTVSKCKGKLGQEEISAVLSSVPAGANYLKRMINQIHHNLLQGPSTIPKDNQATIS